MYRIDRLRRRPVVPSAAAIAAVVIALLLPGLASTAPAVAVPAVRVAVESAECVTEVPGGARCGELSVPVARGVPNSSTATLPYVVVQAMLDTGRSPLVYLSGGVPLSELDVRALAVDRGLAVDRDVVFIERRGGADAEPSLQCEPAVDALGTVLGGAGDRDDGVAAVSAALTACAATWREDGYAAADFGAVQSAADVQTLRQELGYDRWTVMAVGSAASIAVAAAAADPAGVDGIVLDGPDLGAPGIVSSAGVAASLAAIEARGTGRAGIPTGPEDLADAASSGADTVAPGAAQAAVATTEGARPTAVDPLVRSTAVLAAASAELERHPRSTSGATRITLGPDALLALVSRALGDPTMQAALPYALDAVASGRSGALDAIADAAYTSVLSADLVSGWILSCSTVGWPGGAELEDQGDTSTTTLLQAVQETSCSSLGVQPAPPPAAVDIPALVLTAPEQDAALTGPGVPFLPGATSASFSGAGAVPTASSGCAVIVVRNWLAEPDAYRAALCASDDAAVAVVQDSEVSASTRWVHQGTAGFGGWWLLLAVPLLFGLVAIGWSLAWAYRLIAQALRREPVQSALRLGIAPVFGASWAIAGAVILFRAAADSPATQLLGVPAALPWLSVVLLVSCIGLVPVWQGAHRGSRIRVAAISALWAATAIWTLVFVLAWW